MAVFLSPVVLSKSAPEPSSCVEGAGGVVAERINSRWLCSRRQWCCETSAVTTGGRVVVTGGVAKEGERSISRVVGASSVA